MSTRADRALARNMLRMPITIFMRTRDGKRVGIQKLRPYEQSAKHHAEKRDEMVDKNINTSPHNFKLLGIDKFKSDYTAEETKRYHNFVRSQPHRTLTEIDRAWVNLHWCNKCKDFIGKLYYRVDNQSYHAKCLRGVYA